MPAFCGVVNCSNRGNRDVKRFFRLPSINTRGGEKKFELSTRRREKWLLAIRRADLTEAKTKWFRICEDHFVTGKPALMEDINHPDWIPSIKLGYGKTSDSKYIRFLRKKVLKHTKTKLVELQSLVAKSTNDDVDNINVSITDSTHDINGYLFKNDTDTNRADTDGDYTNGRQWNDVIVNVPDDHQYTLHRYSDINESQGQECSNDKVPFDKVPSDNVDNKLPFGKVPSDNIDNKLPFDNVNDKVPSSCVDDLGDCNLSSSFLNNLTKFQQTSSVSVHVQTDLKTTDLDYLNKQCEVTRKKLTEANKKIKLLNTILNLKQREFKTHK